MHDVELPEFVRRRLVAKRGGVALFDAIEPAQTALVVIDMQCAFVAAGAPLEVPVARAIVANINRLAEAMRRAGGTVVWVAMTVAASGADAFPVYHRYFFGEDGRRRHQAALAEGSEMHALYPALDVREGEAVVHKNRFSAFIQGASGLDALCREGAIDTVILTGTLTNVCCESSARDAMMLGYRTFMPADASAALSDEEHLAALISVAQFFGDVSDTDDVIALIEAGAKDTQAAE